MPKNINWEIDNIETNDYESDTVLYDESKTFNITAHILESLGESATLYVKTKYDDAARFLLCCSIILNDNEYLNIIDGIKIGAREAGTELNFQLKFTPKGNISTGLKELFITIDDITKS